MSHDTINRPTLCTSSFFQQIFINASKLTIHVEEVTTGTTARACLPSTTKQLHRSNHLQRIRFRLSPKTPRSPFGVSPVARHLTENEGGDEVAVQTSGYEVIKFSWMGQHMTSHLDSSPSSRPKVISYIIPNYFTCLLFPFSLHTI
jgi:hypothetical protein